MKRNWRASWWGWKEESEKAGLNLNIQKTKIMASGLIISWQIDGQRGNSERFYFLGLQNHCRVFTNESCTIRSKEKQTICSDTHIYTQNTSGHKLWFHHLHCIYLFFYTWNIIFLTSCCSVGKSCPTLCHPVDCSMPGLPVPHFLPEFVQPALCPFNLWCHPNISSSVAPISSFLQSFPAWGLGKWVSHLYQVAKALELSSSLLPVSIQGWFPWLKNGGIN